MTGIKSDVVLWVARVRCSFADSAAPAIPKVLPGTGFWVYERDGTATFITNRHMVDSAYWA